MRQSSFCVLYTGFKYEEKCNGVFPIDQLQFVFFIYVVSQWASDSDLIKTHPQGNGKHRLKKNLIYYLLFTLQ